MPASNLQYPVALARFFLVAAIGLSLDLWTKCLAITHLQTGGRYIFIPHWLVFEYTENHGAVFGIAQGQRWIFILVSLAAIVFLTYLFAKSGRRWFYQMILGLLLAGVLGNMYDRITLGYVRDMIRALPGWQWPPFVHHLLPIIPMAVFPWIFNVADSMLCTGVGLMLIYSFFDPQRAPAKPQPDPATITTNT